MLRFSHQALRRYLAIASAVFFLLLLVNLTSLDKTETNLQDVFPFHLGLAIPGRHPPPTRLPDLLYLDRKRYDLTAEIVYQKRCIHGLQNEPLERYVVENISQPLLEKGMILQQGKDGVGWMGQEAHYKDLEINVPPPFPSRRYPHILFGVATTFDRLNESMAQFSHWLGHSGAPLLAVVVDGKDSDGKFDQMVLQYRNQGIKLIIAQPWLGLAGANEQHFTMIRDLLRHSTPYTEWVAIIDDDTFFPSLYALSRALSQYDPKPPAYLGGLSESFNAVEKHGVMAYGGAGIFLTVPLLVQLDPLIDQCLSDGDVSQGDGLLRRCIYQNTETRFTMVPGLQQVDMMGDLSGFYESGLLPLSLHHWKSWHHVPVEKMAKVSYFCGSCFLQRWRLGSDTVWTNGYSIVVYEGGTEHLSLNEIEGTWDGANDFAWSLGPLRQRVDRGLKKSYLLMDSEQIGNSLRQLYVHRANREPNESGQYASEARDEVIELWWEW